MGEFIANIKKTFQNSLSLAVLATVTLIFLYLLFPPIARTDLVGRDIFFRIRHSLKEIPSEVKNIVLVAIDDATTQTMRYKWPLPRMVYADAISQINSLGPPKVIAFDFVFQGEDQMPGSDDALEAALRSSGNVIVAAYIDYEGRVIEGHPRIQNAAYRTAFVNKMIDRDGVIRRAPIFLTDPRTAERRWSWESEIFFKGASFRNPKLEPAIENPKEMVIKGGYKSLKLPSADGVLDIDYTVKYENIPRVSFQNVLEGQISEGFFKDKIVLIGLTALAFHDVHPTPLKMMPGLALNTNTILTLMRQNFFKRIPLVFSWMLLFLSVLLIFRIALRYSTTRGFILITLISISYLTLDFVMLWYNIIWDLWYVVLSCIVMFFITLIYKQFQTAIENNRLREESVRDPLTGFYTRRFLEVHLKMDMKRTISNARGFGNTDEISIVMIDLDNFKLVNDTFGHQEGDRVLRRLGETVRSSVRKNELVCRYGGDEFCVLLPGTPIENAIRFAEKLRLIIANDPELNYQTQAGVRTFRVTGSLGVASVKGTKAMNPENLLKAADRALYRAKKGGRNQVCAYDPKQDVLEGK